MEEPYEELVKQLVDELHLHCDETGWKKNGKPHWIWALRESMFSVFQISESRGSCVLEEFPLQDWLRLMDDHRQTFLQTVQQSVPEDKDCRNTSKRFRRFPDAYADKIKRERIQKRVFRDAQLIANFFLRASV